MRYHQSGRHLFERLVATLHLVSFPASTLCFLICFMFIFPCQPRGDAEISSCRIAVMSRIV